MVFSDPPRKNHIRSGYVLELYRYVFQTLQSLFLAEFYAKMIMFRMFFSSRYTNLPMIAQIINYPGMTLLTLQGYGCEKSALGPEVKSLPRGCAGGKKNVILPSGLRPLGRRTFSSLLLAPWEGFDPRPLGGFFTSVPQQGQKRHK